MDKIEVLNDKGNQYHIDCKKGDVGKYVLLPGDPFRTDMLAKKLDNASVVAHNREHKTWTGYLDGEKVSITSTGMGGPSAAIAIEELIHCGAETFIRIGTAGRMTDSVSNKEWVGLIATAAIRDEGTTRQYIPIEYPAVANREVVNALVKAAKDNNFAFGEGIVHCKDSFYAQHDPDSLPNATFLKTRWEAWEKGNTKASEMETAALFVLSTIRNVRSGAILAFGSMNEETVQTAFDAIRILIKEEKNKK